MKRLITIFSFLIAGHSATVAQDFHWSLIHLNPLYLNPSYTGMGQKANRITGLYRDQWRAVPVSYSTTSLSYDRRILDKNNWTLGAGVQMLYDRAGSGALSTFRPALTIGAGRYLNNKKQHLGIGFQGAWAVKQLDFSKLTFDSQFDGIAYDPSLSPEEQFTGNNGNYFDFGLGFNFRTVLKKAGKLDLGFSAFNLNAPSYDLLTGSSSEVAQRFVAYTKADIKLGSSKWEFNPGVFYQRQEKTQETLIQSIVSVNLGEAAKGAKLSFGPGYRINDAVVAYVGFQWSDLKVGFAFDGNTSDFRQATSGRGAYELAVNYEFEKKKKPEPKPVVEQPVFEEPPVEEPVDTLPPPPPVERVKEVIDTIEGLKKKMIQLETEIKLLLPVSLYFDNDQPNPRTRLTQTTVAYDQTFAKYDSSSANKGPEFNAFFDEKVQGGFDKLNAAMPKLLALLQAGKTVTIEIKGFTSPLGSTEYNDALAYRRISAIENYFATLLNGALKKYLDNGQLKFDRKPLGESKALKGVSDNPADKQKSVLSPAAAEERRVELLIIQVQ